MLAGARWAVTASLGCLDTSVTNRLIGDESLGWLRVTTLVLLVAKAAVAAGVASPGTGEVTSVTAVGHHVGIHGIALGGITGSSGVSRARCQVDGACSIIHGLGVGVGGRRGVAGG